MLGPPPFPFSHRNSRSRKFWNGKMSVIPRNRETGSPGMDTLKETGKNTTAWIFGNRNVTQQFSTKNVNRNYLWADLTFLVFVCYCIPWKWLLNGSIVRLVSNLLSRGWLVSIKIFVHLWNLHITKWRQTGECSYRREVDPLLQGFRECLCHVLCILHTTRKDVAILTGTSSVHEVHKTDAETPRGNKIQYILYTIWLQFQQLHKCHKPIDNHVLIWHLI